MELGDGIDAKWKDDPFQYRPRDLDKVCRNEDGSRHRLSVQKCVPIMLALTEALEFLHQHGLTHRDIKPQNVIFVNDRPKLADVGLVTEIRPPNEITSWGGTPGYMPAPPEPPGTVQADIYGLGMVLYVMSAGRDPVRDFPTLSTTLLESTGQADFMLLNPIIVKACQPDLAERYSSAAEMRKALLDVKMALAADATGPPA
jgi:serine/threonine protein kinase